MFIHYVLQLNLSQLDMGRYTDVTYGDLHIISTYVAKSSVVL